MKKFGSFGLLAAAFAAAVAAMNAPVRGAHFDPEPPRNRRGRRVKFKQSATVSGNKLLRRIDRGAGGIHRNQR